MFHLPDPSIRQRRLQRLDRFCKNINQVSNTCHKTLKYGSLHSILVDKFHNVTLFVNPKAGASTWKLTLLNSSGTWTWRNADNGPVHDISIYKYAKGIYTRSATQMTITGVCRALSSHCTIVHVRHPFDRLESAFTDKVVNLNHADLRSRILRTRGIPEVAIAQLKTNGSNIHFYEFLRFILRVDDEHWRVMVTNSQVCTLPYG